jgi:hypothetical protein
MDIQTALSTWKPASSAEPLPQKWIARIFERLTAQLGSKVADLYAGVPPDTVQEEWGRALADFHPAEIDRGLTACQSRPFAPTLGEFLRLCRPALDPETAFIEAAHGLLQRGRGEVGDWSHPAVFRAAVALSHEVRTGNFREVRKRWEWQLSIEFAKGWSEIPPPRVAIENNVSLRPASEDEKRRLRELRELFSAGFSEEEVRLGMGEVHRS